MQVRSSNIAIRRKIHVKRDAARKSRRQHGKTSAHQCPEGAEQQEESINSDLTQSFKPGGTSHKPLKSCDTLVFVAGTGGPACTLFGKNSDRPSEEEHEVIHIPAQNFAEGAMVKCTYIEIPQVRSTLSVVLSRPRWLWGCEMGANDYGVVGGNEAVATMLGGELGSERRLLGMDLLRLALERGRTAKDAVEICGALLEEHGQGGGCAEDDDSWTYENGFLFADPTEAYIMETAGTSHWVCERIPPGSFRNISNGLSIRSNIHSCSAGLKELCIEKGWWDGQTSFDWKAIVGAGGRSHANLEVRGREQAGQEHLSALSQAVEAGNLQPDDAAAWAKGMAKVLRDEESGICFRDTYGFNSTGSQISWLPAGTKQATHLFTCASDPMIAAYKRFVFPLAGATEVHEQESVNRSLNLWRLWRQVATSGGLDKVAVNKEAAQGVYDEMRAMEEEAFRALAQGTPGSPATLTESVERELALLVKAGASK